MNRRDTFSSTSNIITKIIIFSHTIEEIFIKPKNIGVKMTTTKTRITATNARGAMTTKTAQVTTNAAANQRSKIVNTSG